MLLQLAFVLTAIIVGAAYRRYPIGRVMGGLGLGILDLWIRLTAHNPSYRCHADDRCRN